MVALHPISPELADPGWADRVTAPAVDALRPEQLAALAHREPWSFLHVTGVDTADPVDADPSHGAAAHLQRLRAAGAFAAMPGPGLVLYRIEGHGRARLGVVGDLDLADCTAGALRRHERTEEAKVRALERHRSELCLDATPISVAYPARADLDRRLAELATRAPTVSTVTADGARHDLWPITDRGIVAGIVAEIAALEAVYLLDGHHRLAAAIRHAGARAGGSGEPDDPGRLLAALFPSDHVQPLDYRRIVRPPDGVGDAELLDATRQRFAVTPVATARAAQPRHRGEMAMRLGERWYRLAPHARLVGSRLPDRLDEAVVERHLLEPVLAAQPHGSAPRVSYVPGTVSLVELERRLGPQDVLVVLHPLPFAELRAVADAGAVLPPKSTYVTPKVAAGLVLQHRSAAVPAAL